MAVRILSAQDVRALLSPADCLTAVEEAFGAWGRAEAGTPGILGVHVPDGAFHIKAAAMRVGPGHYFAAKINGNFPGNPDGRGLPSIQGVIVLSDADTGAPLAVMDSIQVTLLRTAAATAVAARHLARADASSLTLVGCGAQAPSQLRALDLVRPLGHVRLFDVRTARARALAERMAPELSASFEIATDLAAAVRSSDMCVTCTTSTVPFLTRDMVSPGAFIAAVGADSPTKHEIDPGLMAASKVVADSLDQCAVIGDLHHALGAAVMRRQDVHAELGRVVAGLAPGRERPDEVIVFDSTGVGLQDVAVVAVAYQRAEATDRGLRTELDASASYSTTAW